MTSSGHSKSVEQLLPAHRRSVAASMRARGGDAGGRRRVASCGGGCGVEAAVADALRRTIREAPRKGHALCVQTQKRPSFVRCPSPAAAVLAPRPRPLPQRVKSSLRRHRAPCPAPVARCLAPPLPLRDEAARPPSLRAAASARSGSRARRTVPPHCHGTPAPPGPATAAARVARAMNAPPATTPKPSGSTRTLRRRFGCRRAYTRFCDAVALHC